MGTALLALSVGAVAGVGYAAPGTGIPDSKGEIKLCYDRSDANWNDGGAVLSIYNPGKNDKKCAKGQRKLELQTQAGDGERGPRGQQGPAGQQGVAGDDVFFSRKAGPTVLPIPGGNSGSSNVAVPLTLPPGPYLLAAKLQLQAQTAPSNVECRFPGDSSNDQLNTTIETLTIRMDSVVNHPGGEIRISCDVFSGRTAIFNVIFKATKIASATVIP